jgi:hypothetical protein
MSPIATYTERLLQVARTFELYPDRVVVRARWLLKGEFVNNVPLAGLSDEPRPMTIRYRLFKYASRVFALGAIVSAVAIYEQKPPPLSVWAIVGIALASIGFVLGAISWRKVPFVRFAGPQGKGGLDIAKSGPQRDQFEAFVKLVRRQIKRQ